MLICCGYCGCECDLYLAKGLQFDLAGMLSVYLLFRGGDLHLGLSGVDTARVADAYVTAYAEEPFVRVTSSYPATKATLGSNWCLVHAVVDEPNRRLVAFGALDNLVKGAAGSAIQNLNAMRGYPETLIF